MFNKEAQATNEVATLGTAMTPVAGTVYYLKEVPNDYLVNRLVAVRETTEATSPITEAFMFSVVDDGNYQIGGFQFGTNKNELNTLTPQYYTFSKSFKITHKLADGTYKTENVTGHYLNDAIGEESGYVTSFRFTVEQLEEQDTFFSRPAWITLDGVKVGQNVNQCHYSDSDISYIAAP